MAEEGKPRRATGSSRKPASKASGTRKAAAKKPAAKKPASTRKATTARKAPAAKKPAAAARKPAATRKPAARKTASTAKKPAAAKASSGTKAKAASRSSSTAKKPAASRPRAAKAAANPGPKAGPQTIDISDTVAPSVGPHTTYEKHDPETVAAHQEQQSDTDAMGLDKRRPVVGGSYSPSIGRQATLYGVFIVVVVALAIGFKLLADKLDEPPANNPDAAPWSQSDAPQIPAKQPE